MNDTQLETLDQIRQFLEGTEAITHLFQAHFILEETLG
jgi:hypothetical protein